VAARRRRFAVQTSSYLSEISAGGDPAANRRGSRAARLPARILELVADRFLRLFRLSGRFRAQFVQDQLDPPVAVVLGVTL
jgi:hypothetical protein